MEYNLFSLYGEAVVQATGIKFEIQRFIRSSANVNKGQWLYVSHYGSPSYSNMFIKPVIPFPVIPLDLGDGRGPKHYSGVYQTAFKEDEAPFDVEFGLKGGFSGYIQYKDLSIDEDKNRAGDQATRKSDWGWTKKGGGTFSVVAKLRWRGLTVFDGSLDLLPYIQRALSDNAAVPLTRQEDDAMNHNTFAKKDDL
jgi:hypothetical protein